VMIRAARSFETVQMFVPLVVISLVGFLCDHAVMRVRNAIVHW
jgi:ABC-type nitrate/sulfonate/bicarbonate transport system permease component